MKLKLRAKWSQTFIENRPESEITIQDFRKVLNAYLIHSTQHLAVTVSLPLSEGRTTYFIEEESEKERVISQLTDMNIPVQVI